MTGYEEQERQFRGAADQFDNAADQFNAASEQLGADTGGSMFGWFNPTPQSDYAADVANISSQTAGAYRT